MALARASRIQDKLNSNELKSDGLIWKQSTPVLSCFKRALEIDGSNLSLWIEYGTISYALHSFASRQLKQWKLELPSEVVQQVGMAVMARGACHPACDLLLSQLPLSDGRAAQRHVGNGQALLHVSFPLRG